MSNLFLIEKGMFVILKKDAEEIAFDSFADYKKYSGVDLTGKYYVCYQSEGNFRIDDSQEDKRITTDFETVILSELEKIAIYKAQMADPYFRKTLEECIEIKKQQLKMDLNIYLNDSYDLGKQASMNTLYSRNDTTQDVKDKISSVWLWIKTVLAHYYTAKDNIALDWENTTWDFDQFKSTDPNISLKDLV